ncbi:MAG: Maf family protein [Dehalococcoidales bacterium]|nr:Maf family protein [Dehalococcoidales bacterium]
MQNREIVLASLSPRRKMLLEQIGLIFTVDSAGDTVESNVGEFQKDPVSFVIKVSFLKASTVAYRHPDALIIAADTIGYLDNRIIGKPQTSEEAVNILRMLSGRCHKVMTGLTILDTRQKKSVSRSVETEVYFRELTTEEIEAYVKSGEPMDKAGAYAIQGKGAIFIKKICGDFYNVMGMPLYILAECLKEFNLQIIK